MPVPGTKTDKREEEINLERTISGMMGKGSVNHNTRSFSAKNVDRERSKDNVEFCHEDIKQVYHKLFDEALERYNAKQKRSDRKIDDYYEKIRQSKQEKLFHEVIFQIGNKDDMNAKSWEGDLAKEILTEFMKDFQERNPNLYMFSAHLHMDEETPHLHIDFVPFIQNSKRGLDTRVSLKGALAEQGFVGGTRGATEWNQWIESEKVELAGVMERHGVEWLQKGTHNKHLSVLDYEKQERAKEVAQLENKKQNKTQEIKQLDNQLARSEELLHATQNLGKELNVQNSKLEEDNKCLNAYKELLELDTKELEEQKLQYQKEIEGLAGTLDNVERNVRAYDEDRQWQIPEPGTFATAKSYRDSSVKPFVARLKQVVKDLTVKCVGLMEQVQKLTDIVKRQDSTIEWYRDRTRTQTEMIDQLQGKADDLERVKRYAGVEQVQNIINSMKETERIEQEQRRMQRNREWGMSR